MYVGCQSLSLQGLHAAVPHRKHAQCLPTHHHSQGQGGGTALNSCLAPHAVTLYRRHLLVLQWCWTQSPCFCLAAVALRISGVVLLAHPACSLMVVQLMHLVLGALSAAAVVPGVQQNPSGPELHPAAPRPVRSLQHATGLLFHKHQTQGCLSTATDLGLNAFTRDSCAKQAMPS